MYIQKHNNKGNREWIALKNGRTFYRADERDQLPRGGVEHPFEIDGAPYIVLEYDQRLEELSWLSTDSQELPEELRAIIDELVGKFAHNLGKQRR